MNLSLTLLTGVNEVGYSLWNMARTYTKLFQSILDSTIWQEPLPTKVVWVTMLAMADKEGRVWAAIPGLAKRAGVTITECEQALSKFKSPDPYSRSKELDGRRVVEIDGGWELINHGKYREMMSSDERREYQRVKQAEYRSRKKQRNGEATGERTYIKTGVMPHEEGLA